MNGIDTILIKNELKENGGRYRRDLKAWTFKNEELDKVKKLLDKLNFKYSDKKTDKNNSNNIEDNLNNDKDNSNDDEDNSNNLSNTNLSNNDLNNNNLSNNENNTLGNSKNEKKKIIEKLSEECYDMENIISGDVFEDLDIDTLKEIVFIGEGDKKRCYLLETMYDYISSMIKQDKRDKIVDPIDSIKIDDKIIDDIINRYENQQKEKGIIQEKIDSDYKKINGLEMGNPHEVFYIKERKPFLRLVVNRVKNGKKMTPFVIGYLPQQYYTSNVDLEVYSLIGTIGDLFSQNKLFTKESTIDKLSLNKAFDILKISPSESKFLDNYYQKISRKGFNPQSSAHKKLLDEESNLILDKQFKKWWILNPNWDSRPGSKDYKNKFIINLKLIDGLMRELVYLKYN